MRAKAAARRALEEITDVTSKDYADLHILLGDLAYAEMIALRQSASTIPRSQLQAQRTRRDRRSFRWKRGVCLGGTA